MLRENNTYQIKSNYRIVRKIGSGGMATVYEAVNETLETKVAIKVLHDQFTDQEQIRHRFSNEAKLMASLNHRNIVQVKDYDDQLDQPAIIMEYLDGHDLNKRLRNKSAYSEEEVIDIFKQVLSAVAYAHKKGIVHRDIKPSNIIKLKDETVKILDFGIAKIQDLGLDITITGTQIGTPVYMSPEQSKGDKTIDHRSDIYSLGIMMYSMLNGATPYDSKILSNKEINDKIENEPLSELPGNSYLNDLVTKACQKDRGLRFQSCEEWLQELNNGSAPKTEPLAIDKTIFSFPSSDNTVFEVPVKETRFFENNLHEKINRESAPIVENEKLDPIPTSLNKPKLIFTFIGLILIGIAIFRNFNNNENNQSSVNVTIKAQNSNKIISVDGYNAVKIGSQTWMVENLNLDKFRNGDPIPEAQTKEEWIKAGENQQPAWCYYDNDAANGAKYGKLYNWYAINDPRGLAPAGWSVPSDGEWSALSDSLGGEDKAGNKMKPRSGWDENDNETNESSFSGLPGGYRNSDGNFDKVGSSGYWWSTTEHNTYDVYYRALYRSQDYLDSYNGKKREGLSVRCVKD
jgi:uncharacterized protein (TIGR02145 family)